MNVETLAQQFVNATINKLGTDEDDVYHILEQVHQKGISAQFEIAVYDQLTASQKKYLFELNHSASTPLIPIILRDEMSGSQLAKAEDLYHLGYDTWRASQGEYFLEGLVSVVDLSDTKTKVFLGAGIILLGGLGIVAPPAAAFVGGCLIVGCGIYAAAKIIKNGIEIPLSETDQETKENMRDLGSGVGTAAMCLPFLPKGVQGIKNGVNALKAARAKAAAAAAAAEALSTATVLEQPTSITPRLFNSLVSPQQQTNHPVVRIKDIVAVMRSRTAARNRQLFYALYLGSREDFLALIRAVASFSGSGVEITGGTLKIPLESIGDSAGSGGFVVVPLDNLPVLEGIDAATASYETINITARVSLGEGSAMQPHTFTVEDLIYALILALERDNVKTTGSFYPD